MSIRNSIFEVEVRQVGDPVAAGTDDTEYTDIIDMAAEGADAVEFVPLIGTIAATGTVTCKVQSGDAANMSDAADVSGLSVAFGASDDDKICRLNHLKPTKRYCRAAMVRATANVTIQGVVALIYRKKKQPVDNSHAQTMGAVTVVGG